jgi:hypothetical protein
MEEGKMTENLKLAKRKRTKADIQKHITATAKRKAKIRDRVAKRAR